MDGWAEAELAWKLVDSISPSLTAVERAQLYAAIGSGESYSAITAALRALVRDALPLPAWLRTELSGWLTAYQHSADAPHLYELLSRVESP
jgi:hypothetical protein